MPRSPPPRTSSSSRPPAGNTRGTTTCMNSPSLRRFLASTVAPNRTSATLANSAGLKLLTRDADPVAVAVDRDPQTGHEDQGLQEDGGRQQRHGDPLPRGQGDPAGQEEADDAGDRVLKLVEKYGVGRVGVLVGRHAGGGEHHDQADDDQHRGGAEQQVVGHDRGLEALPPRHCPAPAGRAGRAGTAPDVDPERTVDEAGCLEVVVTTPRPVVPARVEVHRLGKRIATHAIVGEHVHGCRRPAQAGPRPRAEPGHRPEPPRDP